MANPDAIGEAADGHTHETACLNCGAPLAGPYCHQCGQHAHVHRTLSAFFHDFLHGVLHFEGKVWRTLPMLAWRPGELTRRYISGERANFVSPIALFLFSVFLLFAVGGITGGLSPAVNQPEIRSGMNAEMVKNARQIAVLERRRADARTAGAPTSAIDAKIDDLRSQTAVMRGLTTGDFVGERTRLDVDELPAWLRGPIQHAARNPDLLLYKLRTNAYKFSWALIPLSVPFLWLLFPFNRRFRAYDHIIFVTYSLSFMTLLVVAALLVGALAPAVAGFAMLFPPVHMYRQLRGSYALGRFGALWRSAALILFATIAALLFVAMLFGLGLFD